MREDERRDREDWDERHTHTRKSRRLREEGSEGENDLHVPIESEQLGMLSHRRGAVCLISRGRVPAVELHAGVAVLTGTVTEKHACYLYLCGACSRLPGKGGKNVKE